MTDFSWLIEKLYYIPGIIVGASFMQFSHALAAHLMGDNTPKEAGRLTIEPTAHIDALGFIFIIIAGFGWAKPVPVEPKNFKHRRLGQFVTSIAAPITNLIISFLTLIIMYYVFGVLNYENEVILNVLRALYTINIIFCAFNLIPIPPLDGAKIIISFLPEKLGEKINGYERYFFIIILLLFITKGFSYIISPMYEFFATGLEASVHFLFTIFGVI
jgi:Zn-dependent protease